MLGLTEFGMDQTKTRVEVLLSGLGSLPRSPTDVGIDKLLKWTRPRLELIALVKAGKFSDEPCWCR